MIVIYDVVEDSPTAWGWWRLDLPNTLAWAPAGQSGAVMQRLYEDALDGRRLALGTTGRSLWAEVEPILCLACGAYDHTADACPSEQPLRAPTAIAGAAALVEPTGETALAPSGPTGLVGAEYDADLRARHAGCSACDGSGWIPSAYLSKAAGQPARFICRREPPF